MYLYQQPIRTIEDPLPLRLTLEYHFAEFLAEEGVDLAKDTIKTACLIIEQLVYYQGNAERMKSKLKGLFPDLLGALVRRKFEKDNERIEYAYKTIRENEAEIALVKEEKDLVKKSNSRIEAENEELSKENQKLKASMAHQQKVLRALQDRLDGVINVRQQIG